MQKKTRIKINSTYEGIRDSLFGMAYSVRDTQRSFGHREDYKQTIEQMLQSGELIKEGTGERGNPYMYRLSETIPAQFETCKHCNGSGTVQKQVL